MGLVWAEFDPGVWSRRYVLAPVDHLSLFAHPTTCQAGAAAQAMVEADCVVCRWCQPWWALVAEVAAGGWQPWKVRLAVSAVAEAGGVQAVP